jgi:hypothetical protein
MNIKILLRSLVLTGLLAATAALSPSMAAQEHATAMTQLAEVSAQVKALTQTAR